jgi:hypothetical protein
VSEILFICVLKKAEDIKRKHVLDHLKVMAKEPSKLGSKTLDSSGQVELLTRLMEKNASGIDSAPELGFRQYLFTS